MRCFLSIIFATILTTSCKKQNNTLSYSSMYFPPLSSSWEMITPSSQGWNEIELNNLYTFLDQKGTKGFIVLKNGRIVVERYFGSFNADSNWYWASAGKTLTSYLVGIAQQEGKLRLSDKTSKYLGVGWTSLQAEKENLITIRHQLTMTTGFDDGLGNPDCTLPSCLQYKADASTRWAYHNAPYTLLEKVVEAATHTTYNNYFQQKIRNPIGMNGLWVRQGYNNVYFSTPRSMARFGLLLLNKGMWDGKPILTDSAYISAQVNSSQDINPSYGYLTWLNGKSSYMLPQTQFKFNGSLISNAPADTYAALGKNDQKLYVVPSQNLVVIRMGEDAGNVQPAASGFDNDLWGKLKLVMKL
ncbi:class C beta-lactamase-related serine hydrolase [Segetibacter sp. 3557_3]|uniref:serine hydrolase domain-containing protein n=1 Tax=Segetibacter sp. 3557_3 TaxID=2547429 RepID=UPI0010589DE3|nr:serine hydrolase [Segetibacter sp. 3557_3]TDH28698.1 class C beta-lactamase-related serine hydrolase [Segetibacter sp. 3557_3]